MTASELDLTEADSLISIIRIEMCLNDGWLIFVAIFSGSHFVEVFVIVPCLYCHYPCQFKLKICLY